MEIIDWKYEKEKAVLCDKILKTLDSNSVKRNHSTVLYGYGPNDHYSGAGFLTDPKNDWEKHFHNITKELVDLLWELHDNNFIELEYHRYNNARTGVSTMGKVFFNKMTEFGIEKMKTGGFIKDYEKKHADYLREFNEKRRMKENRFWKIIGFFIGILMLFAAGTIITINVTNVNKSEQLIESEREVNSIPNDTTLNLN